MINIDYTESESRENSPKRHLPPTPGNVPSDQNEEDEDPSGESELDLSENEYMEKKTDIDSAAILELNDNASPIDSIKKNCFLLP